jgi:alkyl hydroperoxide reductase subunit AhpF
MKNENYGFTLTEILEKRFKVTGNNCPDDMIITIKEFENGYRAECNYSLSTRTNDVVGYQAMHLLPTLEETLEHLLISLKPKDNSKWVKCE